MQVKTQSKSLLMGMVYMKSAAPRSNEISTRMRNMAPLKSALPPAGEGVMEIHLGNQGGGHRARACLGISLRPCSPLRNALGPVHKQTTVLVTGIPYRLQFWLGGHKKVHLNYVCNSEETRKGTYRCNAFLILL